MTDSPKCDHDAERRTEQCLVDALVKHQALIPLTSVEVAEAEAKGVAFEGELPDSLKRFLPSTGDVSKNVVALSSRRESRRAWIGHGLAAILGAAAAAALMWSWQKYEAQTKMVVGRDPLSSVQSNPALPAAGLQTPIAGALACSEACCAGSNCATAKASLRECASQRLCIHCNAGASDSRLRIRIGRLAPSETTQFLLDKSPGRALELCVRVASSELLCTPAQANAPHDEAWAALPLVASPADLLGGLTVQVRWVGETDAMAIWSKPVETNPAVLCNGIAIKPKLPDGELIGSLSVFLDDSYYVELGRAPRTQALLDATRQLKLAGAEPLLYETIAGGDDRFAMSLGPFNKATADSVRWAVLHQGGDAKIVLGFDYRGTAARPSQP